MRFVKRFLAVALSVWLCCAAAGPVRAEYDMNQPWACQGVKPGEDHKVITDITYFQDIDEWNAGYIKKMRQIQEEEQRWQSLCVEDADVVLVAYGISSRVAEGAVQEARKQGIKLGMIRPIVLWPFPRKAFAEVPDTCKGLVTIEMNMMGQMREDVILATKSRFPAYSLATAQRVPTVDQVIAFAEDVIAGKVQEEEVF